MATFEHSKLTNAEIELQKINDREVNQKAAAATRFDQLHEKGAKQFGMLWYSCNSVMAHLRHRSYLPENDRRIDALLVESAWQMAERVAARESEIAQLKVKIQELSDIGLIFDGHDECNEETHEENERLLTKTLDRIHKIASGELSPDEA